MKARPVRTEPYLDSLDAVTGEVIGRFEMTTPAEVARVVEHARRAQSEWVSVRMGVRAKLLDRLAEVFKARRSEIAEVVTRENGKPLAEALFSEVLVSLDSIRWHARRAEGMLRPERVGHHNLIFKGKRGRLEYEPWGVVAVISPWNYPIAIPVTSIVAAVMAGNAVVLKPSELVPWCGALLGELFDQAGFPVDLVQVIQGGGDLGQALIEASPDKVFFTGSVATGRKVAEMCARRLIPSVLELGGKDAMIVLSDADIEAASSAASPSSRAPGASHRSNTGFRRLSYSAKNTVCSVWPGRPQSELRATTSAPCGRCASSASTVLLLIGFSCGVCKVVIAPVQNFDFSLLRNGRRGMIFAAVSCNSLCVAHATEPVQYKQRALDLSPIRTDRCDGNPGVKG